MMTLSAPLLSNLFFVVIRLGTVLLFTPIQAIKLLPIQARLMLIFVLSLIFIEYLPNPVEMDNTRLVIGALAECCNGLILATSLYAVFAVFQIAGQLLDDQMGLNSIAIFNPSEHSAEPLSSHLLSMLAVLFFFGTDGHLWLFKALAHSFTIIPAGSISLFMGFTPIIKQFGFMFSMAFMIASPIVLALLIIDLCGGVLTRNMPQINTWFLTLPIKIMLGLFLFSLMIDYLLPQSNAVFEHLFQTWGVVLS